MNLFKMLWLTSEEREILRNAKKATPVTKEEVASIVRQELTESKRTDTLVDTSGTIFPGKVYKNIFYSNQNITVVFPDGDMISKAGVGQELFKKVKNATTRKEIEDALIEQVVAPIAQVNGIETQEERELISKNLDIFVGNDDFEVLAGHVMLKGVSLPMPAPVVASFIEILEKLEGEEEHTTGWDDLQNQYIALKMFWLKLALNTLPQSRNDLLLFIRKNNVKITRNGNLILYRRIVSKDGADKELVTFVTQEYYRLKKSGQDPRQFAIYKPTNGTYQLVDLTIFDPAKSSITPFCNLQQMYLELPTYNSNDFTSAHDDRVSIKLGGIYSIPESKINLNNGICAAGGLHAAAVDYNYSGFGDTPVVVLVNPSKAITVPLAETGKLRTTEMFIACVNDKPQGVHFDESALTAFDNEYHDFTLEELETAARTKSFEKLSVLENVPAISLLDLNKIKDMLKTRIQNVAW